jgi:predicted transcriptional regulator
MAAAPIMTACKPRFKNRGSGDVHGVATLPTSSWFFLSNHGNVLLCIARDPAVRISELASLVGIGERAAQKIVADLVAEGYVRRTKEGRRNRYEINRRGHLRHPLFSDLEIGPLVETLRNA